MAAALATAGAAPTVAGDDVTAPMVVGDDPLAAGPGTGAADRVESNPTPFVLRLTVTLMAPIVVNPTDRPSQNCDFYGYFFLFLFCGGQILF